MGGSEVREVKKGGPGHLSVPDQSKHRYILSPRGTYNPHNI